MGQFMPYTKIDIFMVPEDRVLKFCYLKNCPDVWGEQSLALWQREAVVCSWGRNRSPLQEELGSVLSAAQEIWAPWLHLFNRSKCSQMGMCVKAWTSLFGLSLIHRPAAASACSSCYHFWVIAEGCCSFSFKLSLFLPPPSHDLTFKNS